MSMLMRLCSGFKGRKVGTDRHGNLYFESRNVVPGFNHTRRWVVYSGRPEATNVPPEWHGWLHHTYKEPPTRQPLPHKPWEKPHAPNQTGTPAAYHPAGSLYRAEPAERRDYDAWQPE